MINEKSVLEMYFVAKYMQKTAFLIPIFAFIPALNSQTSQRDLIEITIWF